MHMNHAFENLLRDATRLTHAGRLMDATAAIQRALGGRTASADAAPAVPAHTAPAEVLEGCVFEVLTPSAAQAAASQASTSTGTSTGTSESALARSAAHVNVNPNPNPNRNANAGRSTSASKSATAAAFSAGIHHHAGLTRDYKLFVPTGDRAQALPLLVMLHGCTQNPDDFAAGTGMNKLAQEQGFCVLYPAQSADANPSRCWNWFKHNHQARGQGEPALIASLTQAVMKAQGIDPAQVYIAGLSAGGAMAALVGAAYPELFAAVGVHSGLAPGAAKNLPDALAAMQGSAASKHITKLPLPVIVFHGDQDHTVHPNNAAQIIDAAQNGAGQSAASAQVEQGTSGSGQRFTRTVQDTPTGAGAAEHWLLHGAGHAWSGGQASGSYTDPRGVDASREMLRFFRAHPLRGGH